jgi:site-specific recombinase
VNEAVAAPPDRDAFVKQFSPEAPKARPLRDLHALLLTADPAAQLSARLAWLEQLARWLNRGPLPGAAVPGEPPRTARLRLLVRVLERVVTFRLTVSQLIAAVLREVSAFHLLSRLGLPGDRSFMAESMDRISRRLLPAPRDDNDLSRLLARLFARRDDAAWLAELDPELVAQWLAVTSQASATWRPLARAAADAALLLATRISALGLSDDIRARSPGVSLRDSPLFRLPREADALLALLEGAPDASEPDVRAAFEHLRAQLELCEATVRSVTRNLEQFGVSVDVVYRLEVMTKSMARLDLLLDQLMPRPAAERAQLATRLTARLIEDRLRDRSTVDLARTSLHLLARKIIERAGHTGEHYITSSRSEYFKMLASAAGGGALTSVTAALKYVIAWGHFAPFVEGALASCNYALSFLIMQALGFTLATKQPSMTAAALAATLHKSANKTELDELVTMIARITRSQLAAAIGNIGLVIPAVLALDYLYTREVGHAFLDRETASYVLHSLHPLQSGTVFYAAFTGVLLWISSIGAGWVENWAVYRRLPEALAQHRMQRVLGVRLTGWISRVFARNVSGVGGNVSLGVLLGMIPVLGKFFGLPLDVRHVTLSTGALALSVNALREEALSLGVLPALVGIAIIGMLNFGVSFVLALLVALRAREVERRDQLRLLRAVLARFTAKPAEFMFPP